MKKYLASFITRKTVKNGIWLYALQFFNTVLPLVTLPYITRVLGASQYGIFSIILNFVSYLQVIIEYGFGLSATRKVALADSEENLSMLFTQVVCSRMLLYFLCTIITIGNILIFDRTLEINVCFLILLIGLIGYVFQENWMFQGKQEMKFISVSTIVARSTTTILVFVFIKSPDDLLLYCILYSLSPIIANSIGTIVAMKKYKLRFMHIHINDLVDSLKAGWYVFFSQLSAKIFGAVGITFLGMFASNQDVGIYSAIYKLPYIIMLLWNPIAQIIYPITSKKILKSNIDGYSYIRKLKRYFIGLFGMISILVGFFAKTIIFVAFGEEYVSQFYIVYPLLGWMLLGINNNFEGIQTLVGSGHDKEYSKCFQIGAVGTVFLNFIFISIFGIDGAAIAPLISEGLLCILLKIKIKQIGTFTNS